MQIYGMAGALIHTSIFPAVRSKAVEMALANHRPKPPSYEVIRKHQKEHGPDRPGNGPGLASQ